MRALVFGETGQVAREIARLAPDSVCLGRNRADPDIGMDCAFARTAFTPSVGWGHRPSSADTSARTSPANRLIFESS